MSHGNQPPAPSPPRTPKFAFTDPVSLLPPNDHILDGKVAGVTETATGYVYDVHHSSGLLRQVREDLLRERPARVEKLYRGQLNDEGVPVVTVKAGDTITMLHDENGLNWGYAGGGPGRLARALVKDLLGVDDVAIADKLKWDLVLHWPKDQPWTLLEHHLRADIEAAR